MERNIENPNCNKIIENVFVTPKQNKKTSKKSLVKELSLNLNNLNNTENQVSSKNKGLSSFKVRKFFNIFFCFCLICKYQILTF